MSQYGVAPTVVTELDLVPSEMCFVQYMPIVMPEMGLRIPDHLEWVTPLMKHVEFGPNDYVYLTAKHIFVSGMDSGNRPGWHSDGYGTPDINYVWCDSEPTEFSVGEFELSADCTESLAQMEEQAIATNTVTYSPRTLLKLDQFVIHRAPTNCTPGFRAFVKVSVSSSRYNLVGNAHNYLFSYNWEMVSRSPDRNHPTKPLAVPYQYYPDIVPVPDALTVLLGELEWVHKDPAIPRKEYYVHQQGLPYSYGSGKFAREYNSQPDHPYIAQIRESLRVLLGVEFDVVFLNLYEHERHHLGWHADDSPEMSDDHPIVTVSIGAEREIWFRSNLQPDIVSRVLLQNGSACVMLPGVQDTHQHRIPKCDRVCGPRISLTFRKYVYS